MIRPLHSGLALLGFALLAAGGSVAEEPRTHAEAFDAIDAKEIEADIRQLAAPGMEGRDAPSEGFRKAGKLLAARLAELGFEPAADAESALGSAGEADAEDEHRLFHRPYSRELWKAVPTGCALVFELPGEDARSFSFGEDFTPLLDCNGDAAGHPIFAGFGIDSSKNRYDDFGKLDVEDAIVVLLEGEPRHKRKFDGLDDFVKEANIWEKLGAVEKMGDGPAGVLVVRRSPQGADPALPNVIDFRHTHASFAGYREPVQTGKRRAPVARRRPPVLEITPECASELFGVDIAKLAGRIDQSGKPVRIKSKGAHRESRVRMRSKTEFGRVRVDNIVGILRGSDPELADEYILIGAHYDHIGVAPNGFVGQGADDNASGCSALLQIAKALSIAPPRRSVIVCFFGSEEDGLLGSQAIAEKLPVDRDAIKAMLNLDMVGRGETKEVAVLGIKQNPSLEKVLRRARKLDKTGVSKIVMRKGEELFARSDQHSFHQIGIPVLFFFEGLPISRNVDYHTWRDVPERVDIKKVRNTARLAYNTAWLLATDDDTPPPPAR